MINLGYMSSLRLGPGSALGEELKLKVRFVNQKKEEKKWVAKEAESEEGKGSPGLRPGKGWWRLRCPSLFLSSLLNSICSPKFFFLFDPLLNPLEPSSGNSNFIYQSPTFSKGPFFSSYINFKLKRSFLSKTPMPINWRHTSSQAYILKKLFYLLDRTYTECPEMTLQSIPVVYFLFVFYFDICNVACGGKNMFSLRTERAVSVFQRVEELSISICAEATSKFFALNEVVFGPEGFGCSNWRFWVTGK